jgi:AraC-like DNA-binding protein
MPDASRCSISHQYSPGSPRGHFHLVGARECLLIELASEQRIQLLRGDLVVVLGDVRHMLAVAPGDCAAPSADGCFPALYGEFEFPMGGASPLSRALPNCVIVRATEASQHYRELVGILLGATRNTRPGQRIVINKLASGLLAFAVCEYANRMPARMEIFAALLDGRIARVLDAIHERLDEQWTIHSLAALAGMSRSTFALHFATLMGVPPMRYVTSWKVAHGKQLLQDQRLSVARVAEMLGYSSEAAFRKLFKRVEGIGPGRARAAGRFDRHREDAARIAAAAP